MADEANNTQDTQGAAQEHAGDQQANQQAQGQERDEVDQVSDVQALRHEAASRRRQLRTVEAERDGLRERIDAQDRAEVERAVAGSLADPTDVWSAVELDAVRGEDGAVDEAKVSETLAGLLERKPHYALPQERVNLHQGARQEIPQAPSFGQALKSGGRQ